MVTGLMTNTSRHPLNSPDGKAKLLPAVHPNVGIQVRYEQQLDKLLARMHQSLTYWLRQQYRVNSVRMPDDDFAAAVFRPSMAEDASPAVEFIWELRRIGRRWQARFNQMATQLGEWFSRTAFERTDAAMKQILKDAGWTVQFRMTPAVRDVLRATIHEQVNLIRSIGQAHLTTVTGMVLRSVQAGHDMFALTNELERVYGVSRKRAALIARDQNRKAVATLTRLRQQELGITRAVWVHSGAGKEPRPHHVAFAAGKDGGPIYNVAEGAPLADNPKGGMTFPGWEINCRCISRSIIPGLRAA